MWIFMSDAFVSIVQHFDEPGLFMVRARIAGDLERLFPGFEVVETPDADYRYRVTLSAELVADVIRQQVAGINYPNFKNSVKDDERHRVYSSVWSVMFDWQYRVVQRLKATQKKARKVRAVSLFD